MFLPMSRVAENVDDVRDMADEVARLMAERFGGARRGEFPTLTEMMRRRGGALPRRLRKQARTLAAADQLIAQPRAARQMNLGPVSRAHALLVAYLRPLGSVSRWKNRSLNFAASIVFALLVLGGLILWLMVRRGHL